MSKPPEASFLSVTTSRAAHRQPGAGSAYAAATIYTWFTPKSPDAGSAYAAARSGMTDAELASLGVTYPILADSAVLNEKGE